MKYRPTACISVLLLAVGLLISGCGSAAPAAPTSTPPPTPAAAPTIVPETSAPAATTVPQATPTTGAIVGGPTTSAGGNATAPTAAATPIGKNNATTSATPAAGATCTNNAAFVSDVTVPDNTAVATGQAFNKIWRIRNTGTCTWGAGYRFAFVTGQAMTTNTTAGIAVPAVASGATVDIVAPLTAPNAAGTYRGFWQMRAPNGTAFGARVWVLVRVVRLGQNGNGGTPAPNVSETPAASQTPGATLTP